MENNILKQNRCNTNCENEDKNQNNNQNKNQNKNQNVIIDSKCNMNEPDEENSFPLTKIDWTKAHENILVEWADQAMCYKWMHGKSRLKYHKINAWFTIPVIIMSTLTGTANFASEKVPEQYREWFSIGIGSINILAGILTTIQQFLKVTELNEAHRVASISWDKFYRNIKVELSKNTIERSDPYQMIQLCKEEFDRLVETSPPISQSIIVYFIKIFSGGTIYNPEKLSIKQKNYQGIKKPEICNILESTRLSIYKEPISKKPLPPLPHQPIKKTDKELEFEKVAKQIKIIIDNFKREYHRKPSTDEIRDNLSIPVKNEQIDNVLQNH